MCAKGSATARLHHLPLPGAVPGVWGVLNLTPDSFSDGGRHITDEVVDIPLALAAARAMAAHGAAVLDVGGESTRPGSLEVSADEECARVLPLLDALAGSGSYPIPISIDTRRARVAVEAARRGATIVNDTSALRDDPELAAVVAELGLHVVLMHRQGSPRTMQTAPRYNDLVTDIQGFFETRVEAALEAGIPEQRIILDPGLGFGKRRDDNYTLMTRMAELRVGSLPMLIGASRKSFLGRFDRRPFTERLGSSLAFAAAAREHRVEWIRVHDVADTVAFLATWMGLRDPARSAEACP